MSLFRAVRSLVGRSRESGEAPPPESGNLTAHRRSSSGPRGRVELSSEEQSKLDKLKSLWAIHSNLSENERDGHFVKVLSAFVALYREKELAFAIDTFGERYLKQMSFLVAKKFVRDVRVAWKVNLPAESNSKGLLKMLGTTGDENGGYDSLCALEILCCNVR
jgi:hypothetical protein